MLFDAINLSILDKRINFDYYFSHIFQITNTKFMKKALLLCLLVALTVGLSAQSQRMALLEHFTQASCGPCATYNPLVKQYFTNNPTNRIAIKYQTSWPGFDPMNLHNPTQVADRVSYYGVSGVPDVVIDGNVAQGNPGNLFANGQSSTMDARVGVASNFDITVFHTLSNDLTAVNVDAIITSTAAVANANLKAHIVVVEKHIAFPSAPGSNGEKDFYNVMKRMLPNSNGTDLQDVWATGNTVVLSESWNFSNVYNIGDLGVVVFIQDDVTKEVYQAGFSEFITLPQGVQSVDLATTSQGFSGDYCTTTYTPEATVANTSNKNLDSVAVSYTINGGAGVTQMVAVNAGASANVSFPSINVAFGDEVVFNTVVQDAGYIDLAAINNSVTVNNFIILDPNFDNGTDLFVEWNNGTIGAPSPPGAIDDNPEEIRAFYVDNTVTNPALGWNLGGNGNSNGCFRWDFYSILANKSSSLIFEEIDLTGKTGCSLNFTYAYAQYQAENDRLAIFASDDCGATWTQLFNKAGSSLSTAPATTNRFYPNVNNWKDESLDMSMFDNSSDVIIRVTGTSAYGNSLYIDDIKTTSLVSTEDVKLEASLNVYPNPTVDNFTLEFELTDATKLNINLVNAMGQTVRTIDNSNFNSGKHLINVNTSDLAAGTYFVTIRNEEGVTTKTVTIIR